MHHGYGCHYYKADFVIFIISLYYQSFDHFPHTKTVIIYYYYWLKEIGLIIINPLFYWLKESFTFHGQTIEKIK